MIQKWRKLGELPPGQVFHLPPEWKRFTVWPDRPWRVVRHEPEKGRTEIEPILLGPGDAMYIDRYYYGDSAHKVRLCRKPSA